MSYGFVPGKRYRMPTHFGPTPGPRQSYGGRVLDYVNTPRQTILSARFEADAGALETLLPPGFSLRRPELAIDFAYMTDIDWLAGRAYNTFGVSIPARFEGQRDVVDGDLLLVLWENLADPILSGREELGFAKLYSELPPPATTADAARCEALWDGFMFAALTLHDLSPDTGDPDGEPETQGLLHYKYVPRTGAPGVADAEYAVLTPLGGSNLRVEEMQTAANATISFQRGTWEQLPTLVHIVDRLADIPIGRCLSARQLRTIGAKDLSDQRALS